MISEAEIAIGARFNAVRERIAQAARRAGRAPAEVCLVLASKTRSAAELRAAYQAGARDFGENYVQEALAKRQALAGLPDLRWHFIGHLQTNKAKAAADSFALVHSLDSLRLARALAGVATTALAPVKVLIEVNLGGEASKTGLPAAQVKTLLAAAAGELAGKLEVLGLMVIPPPGPSPEHSRPYFQALRELRAGLARDCGLPLSELSMGMSEDFEIAIEEGATIVRVGRAVFGERSR